MPTVRAFTGLLYDPGIAGPLDKVTTPPYDAITSAEQERFYRASPYNIVRVVLGKAQPGDDESANQYTRAASYLRRWVEERVIAAAGRRSVYPYQMAFQWHGSERTVKGVIAEVELETWGGSIVPHERTTGAALEDRLNLLRSVQANLSPVYAVFRGPSPALSSCLNASIERPADREMTDEAGTRHRLWIEDGGEQVVARALRGRQLLIADGHHRYAVALAYREEMRRRHGPGPWDSMMMLIVDAGTEDPPVLPFHRVLLRGPAPPEPRGERVQNLGEILASLRDDRLTFGTVRLEDGGVAYRVAVLSGDPPTICALHDQVLDRGSVSELRFVPDARAAERLVVGGAAVVAYLLPPTRVDRVWEVVESNRRLPQKSTYFWPKPRTGMLLRSLVA